MALPFDPSLLLPWVKALGTPALAAVGAAIAYQQKSIAKVNLQHDLFDRRIKIYRAVHHAMTLAVLVGTISDEALSNLIDGTSIAPFVFNRSLGNEIKRIEHCLLKIYNVDLAIKRREDRSSPPSEIEKLHDLLDKNKEWIRTTLATLPQLFEPHMRIGSKWPL